MAERPRKTPKAAATSSSPLRALFQTALNKHGHAFEVAVRAEIDAYSKPPDSAWLFHLTHLPVECNGVNTEIDLLFRHIRKSALLIVECKRVNPAFGAWCFAKVGQLGHEISQDQMILDLVKIPEDGRPTRTVVPYANGGLPHYFVGQELKLPSVPGDEEPIPSPANTRPAKSSTNSKTISDALTQVFRGTNGLIQRLHTNSQSFPAGVPYYLIPAVVTTASLWVSDVDLEDTDLASGTVDLTTTSLREVPWLCLKYPVSPGLKFKPSWVHPDALRFHDDSFRSAWIVNAKGIPAWLKALDDLPLRLIPP